MFTDLRAELPAFGAAFVATLVLGLICVMHPSFRVTVLQGGGWLLPPAACLVVSEDRRERGGR
ncbi:hypothetical protein [Streptomyces sp. NPDC008001]|uniref:hypothetical protein n=1 Tax=Streptomyces sp. NPDC008001 TaxID=3364804 RepID=UPI0036E41ACA